MYSTPSHRPGGAPPGLSRYGSAPGSLLKGLVDSVVDDGDFSPAAAVGSESFLQRYFSGDSSCLTAESSCKADCNVSPSDFEDVKGAKTTAAAANCSMGLEMSSSYGFNEMRIGEFAAASNSLKPGPSSSQLIRHSSSPAGLINHFMLDNNGGGGGFSAARGLGSYSCRPVGGNEAFMNGTLKPQLSFSRQDSLSQISEISIPDVGDNVLRRNGSEDGSGNVGQSFMSGNFRMGSWDDTNSIVFSSSPSKRAKDINGEIAAALNSVDSEFSMPSKTMDISTVEKLLHMQQDSIACKIRAKRGCATHPRSIAERDRRTRISEKLRKLQELMPNMDKQTNTAEMLDLAVQYIKSLQVQVQDLQQERANCTCAGRHAGQRS